MLPPSLLRLRRLLRNVPPNSMQPMVLRINGCRQALNASSSQNVVGKSGFRCEHGFASYIIRIHTLPSPRKGTAVEMTISPLSSASLRMASYRRMVSCLSPPKKSTLIPLLLYYAAISFPFTDNGIVHVIGRTLYDIIPVAAGTIP